MNRQTIGHRALAGRRKRHETRWWVTEIAKYTLLTIGTLIMILPFYWMILSSFRDLETIFLIPPVLYPNMFQWQNYVDGWTALPYANAYINSAVTTVSATALALFTISLAAFAFAKIDFKGKNAIFTAFLGSMMVPFNAILVPTYLIIRALGMFDTKWALIIPNGLFNAYGVFLLRQFFKSLPNDYQEAAIIDGAGYIRIWAQIYLPLIKPALVSLGIFLFMGNWNNFMGALIFLNKPENFTVPVLLSSMRGNYSSRWHILMACVTIATLPTLIVYIAAQKYIVAGIALTGLKA